MNNEESFDFPESGDFVDFGYELQKPEQGD
jgi:hypothetical protein